MQIDRPLWVANHLTRLSFGWAGGRLWPSRATQFRAAIETSDGSVVFQQGRVGAARNNGSTCADAVRRRHLDLSLEPGRARHTHKHVECSRARW